MLFRCIIIRIGSKQRHRRVIASDQITLLLSYYRDDLDKPKEALIQKDLSLPSPLRPYQWQGVHFLIDQGSGLIADEMGLGKTVQVAVALSLLLPSCKRSRALIVVPASLRLNWERELLKWAPNLSVRRLQGDAEDRAAQYRLPINVLM